MASMNTDWATGLTSSERMLLIPCPTCGERHYTEFRYGGDAAKRRPAHAEETVQTWCDYVFLFDNPKGAHVEYWQHVLGCRQWLILERDTATNAVGSARLASEEDVRR
jgi:methylglutamate dehydrogenase subunit B